MVDRRKMLIWEIVLTHEIEVRMWLTRGGKTTSDAEDIIQEAYCRLWAMKDVGKIANPKAYFFRMARNIAIDQLRSARSLPIESRSEIGELRLPSEEAGPERTLTGRQEWERVRQIIESLPPRCRTAIVMRKIEGVSQREIATRLGVTENTVENDVARGLKVILKAVAEGNTSFRGFRSMLKRRRDDQR